MRRPASLVAMLGTLWACHSSTLVADGPVTVLENPYPSGYPSTNPMPNSIVATLPAGERVKVKSVGYGKDFKYYKVALPAGRSGYVIFGDGPFHIEE